MTDAAGDSGASDGHADATRIDLTYPSRDSHAAIAVHGPLTSQKCGLLREAVIACRDAEISRLLCDLTHVTRIDAAGLGVLVYACRRITDSPHSGCLHLVDSTGTVTSALRRTGLHRLLPPHPDFPTAAASCPSHRGAHR